MFKTLKIAALSALLGLGTLASMPATAQADSFYFGISGGGATFGFRTGPDHRPGPGRHWDRPGRFDCSARDALRKADRMGINRAHIRGENRRVIHVGGRSHGRPVTVTFAKAPHCPVLR